MVPNPKMMRRSVSERRHSERRFILRSEPNQGICRKFFSSHLTRASRHQLHLGARCDSNACSVAANAWNAVITQGHMLRVLGLADFLNHSFHVNFCPSGHCASHAGELRHRVDMVLTERMPNQITPAWGSCFRFMQGLSAYPLVYDSRTATVTTIQSVSA